MDSKSQSENEETEKIDFELERSKVQEEIKKNLRILGRTTTGSFSFLQLNLIEKEMVDTYGALERYKNLRFLNLSKNKLKEVQGI